MNGAYYNEFDPFAAAWLRELIKAGHIAPGDVDERSILDVKADDLKSYTQCHFFAGIGGWSLALRLALWDDGRPVWTGSAPCQPFSSAGKQAGKADKRHLFPAWLDLIRQCRPATIFGEQVSSAIAHGWLDDVYQGLEAEGYAIGAAVLPACSVGAPHKRDRLWFVANADNAFERRGLEQQSRDYYQENATGADDRPCRRSSAVQLTPSNVANASGIRLSKAGKRVAAPQCNDADRNGSIMGYTKHAGLERFTGHGGREEGWKDSQRPITEAGFWDGEWISCPDGKARLIEPSIPLLANGVPNRVGKLRGYGNAIVPQVAAEFIKASQ